MIKFRYNWPPVKQTRLRERIIRTIIFVLAFLAIGVWAALMVSNK